MPVVVLPDRTLDHEVAESSFHRAAAWASKHCESFICYDIQWVGDISYEHDHMAEYEFDDERDAFLFRLKFL